jgi:hypothetical protein
MDIGLAFWILMLIWLVFGFFGDRLGPWAPWGGTLLLFILLLLLGWHDFGAPLRG